jgi:hypothetical protein
MSSTRSSLLLKSFLVIGVFWTLVIAFLAVWAVRSEKQETTASTLTKARSYFNHVVLTRHWNADHGGVYVPVTAETTPNPYLEVPRRDVTTRDGFFLTLINPAFMTRQLSELAERLGMFRFHITSMDPIRPANGPEPWEAEALMSFESGLEEYHAWHQESQDGSSSFRYMAPLYTEQNCLQCHAKQGYREGDLRGGISVSLPADDILLTRNHHITGSFVRYSVIWMVGMGIILFSFRLSKREYTERSDLIGRLEKALSDIKTLKGLIPICATCKKVRTDEGYWDQIEQYVRERSDAEFSHSICPECMERYYKTG